MAVDLTTMEFIQVLRRFFSIRGYPAVLLSDNGSQMVGAARELREMVQGLDSDQLSDYCAERSIHWLFTTPAAPHQNGCAEALVKSCKRALKKAIGEQVLTPFELYTCLLEVANLVNQHPIGRGPNDPDDGKYHVLTTCSWDAQQRKFLKAHSATRKTRDAVWNLSREWWTPSGNVGAETYSQP